MSPPQSGILPAPGPSALFLVLRVRTPEEQAVTVARVVARVPALTRAVAGLDPRARLVSTVGLGSEFWDVVSPGKRPLGLRPFTALEVGGRRAPRTGGR